MSIRKNVHSILYFHNIECSYLHIVYYSSCIFRTYIVTVPLEPLTCKLWMCINNQMHLHICILWSIIPNAQPNCWQKVIAIHGNRIYFLMLLTHNCAILQLFLTHILTTEKKKKKKPVQQQLGITVFLK